jgi:hypothetical protein
MNKFDDYLISFNNFQNKFIETSIKKTEKAKQSIANNVKGSSKYISETKILGDANIYSVNLPNALKKINIYVNIKDIEDKEKEFIFYERFPNDKEGNYVLKIFINANHDI